mgnify:CR=1 FL=1
MTRDEFESKRAENLDRLAEIRETSSTRNEEYKNKEIPSGFDKVLHFFNSFVGTMAKSAENTMRNMK